MARKKVIILGGCLFANYMYILFFQVFLSHDLSVLLYMLMQGAMSTHLLYKICYLIFQFEDTGRIPMVLISLLVTSLYFFMGSVKYAIPYIHREFISDNNLRLIGSFIVFISMEIAVLIVDNIYKKKSCMVWKIRSMRFSFGILFTSSIVYFAYVVIEHILHPQITYAGYKAEYKSTAGTIQFLIDVLVYFLIFATCYFFEVEKKKTWIPSIIVILAMGYDAVMSGSRSKLLFKGVLFLYLFLYLGKIKVRTVYRLILIIPLLFIIFTVLVFNISGRMELGDYQDTNDMLIRQICRRFDYSDLPMSIMRNTSYFSIELGTVIDGIKNTIPNYFMNEQKVVDESGYYELLKRAKMRPGVDYGESLFSMGQNIGGIFGMLLFYPVVIWIYDLVDRRLTRKGDKGLIIKVMIGGIFVFAGETGWIGYMVQIRNSILCLFAGSILFRLFKKQNF